VVNAFVNLLGTLLVHDGKNYDKGNKQMKVLFGFQDVLEIIDSGFEELLTDATEVQRIAQIKLKIFFYKALFLIHRCVNP